MAKYQLFRFHGGQFVDRVELDASDDAEAIVVVRQDLGDDRVELWRGPERVKILDGNRSAHPPARHLFGR